MRQIVFHGERSLLVFRLGRSKISAPFPVVHRAQNIAGSDALALVRENLIDVAVNRRGQR